LRVFWLIVAWALASASARAEQVFQPPQDTRAPGAAAFDALFKQLDDGGVYRLDAPALRSQLAELDRLRPAGDSHRDLLARALRCNWGFPDNIVAARPLAEAGLHDARIAHDADAEVRFLHCRGAIREQIETPAQALADYLRAIEIARRIESDRLLADGLVARGNVHSLLGEQGRAVLDFLDAQRLYERAGRRFDAETNLLNLAIAYRRMGDAEKAMEYLRQSAAFAEREQDWNTLLTTLYQSAFIHEDAGRADAALADYQRGLALAMRQGSTYDVGGTWLGMANAYLLKHQPRQALQALDRAEAAFEAFGDKSNQEMVDLRRGQAYAGMGDHARALDAYARAAKSIEASGNLRYMAYLYEARAETLKALGRGDAAIADLERYIQLQKRIADANRSQQSEVLRYQFDTARRDLENTRLQAEQQNQQQKLDATERVRRWQALTLVSAGVLMVVLLCLLWRQLRKMRRMRVLAMTDELTGVGNRRRIDAAGELAVAQARANGTPLAVLTFDLDDFKRINDTLGHAAGDRVLIAVARTCEQVLRTRDLLGRLGGEEFVVLVPETDRDDALLVGERLRAAVASLDLSAIAPDLRVTISLGMALLRQQDTGLHDVIDRADVALYRAKAAGKNRVEAEA
jgi:diguanylate cyclase (GGDEF)-like protein